MLRQDPSSVVFVQLAEEHRRAGSLDKALVVCRSGLIRHLENTSARVLLARIYCDMRRFIDARAELERVRETAPENLMAIRLLCDVCWELQDWTGAESLCIRVLAANPSDSVCGERIRLIQSGALPGPLTAIASAPEGGPVLPETHQTAAPFSPGFHTSAPASLEGFVDLSTRTRLIRILLYLGAAMSGIAVFIDFIWMGYMKTGAQQALVPVSGWASEAEAIRLTRQTLRSAEMAVLIPSAVFILMWIYQANRNARKLGAERMNFSPGWSIGWYFIPIAMFWKPHEAMVEIWKASKNPTKWRDETEESITSWWWAFYIVSLSVLDAGVYGIFGQTKGLEVLGFLTTDLSRVALSLLFAEVVTRISDMQRTSAMRAGPCPAA